MLPIIKLEYRHYFYNISKSKNELRTTTVITNDGTISIKLHSPKGEKIISVKKSNYPIEEFKKLCQKIESCIKNANTCFTFTDDSAEKLTIFYQYNHIQEVDRGLGDARTYIGKIVYDFLDKYESYQYEKDNATISENNYLELKKKFGHLASWAIWKMPDGKPKSNTSDLTIFNDEQILSKLNTNYVFVGLNAAANHGDYNEEKHDWHCFHSAYAFQNDYKLRYALADTRFWGSYITDIIKEHKETDSSKVVSYIKKNPEILAKNVELFEEELGLLGGNPVLIALGTATYSFLNECFGEKYKIYKITHYAHQIGKEKYRDEVLNSLKDI